jgi:hypothetical protein
MSSSKTKSSKASSAKEDELILQDFSRRVSTKSSALFYGNAFIVSAVPIWLYWRIHHLVRIWNPGLPDSIFSNQKPKFG